MSKHRPSIRCLLCRKSIDLPFSRCYLCATGKPRDPRIVALAERPRTRERHPFRIYAPEVMTA